MIQTALLEQTVQEEIFEDVVNSEAEVQAAGAVENTPVEQAADDWQSLDVNWDDLTPAQNIALVALSGGRTKAEAARMAGVHRNTLYRWLDEKPLGEAVTRARGELREAAQARLHSLADEAAGCIQMAMRGGDARTALQLIKLLGTLDDPKPTSREQSRATHDDGRFTEPWESGTSAPPDDSDDPDDPKASAERSRMARLIQFERDRQALLRAATMCVGLVTGVVGLLCLCLLGCGGWVVRRVADIVEQGWLAVSKSVESIGRGLAAGLAAVAMTGSRICLALRLNWVGRSRDNGFVNSATSENLAVEQSARVQEEVRIALARRQWHPIVDRMWESLRDVAREAMGRFTGVFVPCFAPLRHAASAERQRGSGMSLRLAAT